MYCVFIKSVSCLVIHYVASIRHGRETIHNYTPDCLSQVVATFSHRIDFARNFKVFEYRFKYPPTPPFKNI